MIGVNEEDLRDRERLLNIIKENLYPVDTTKTQGLGTICRVWSNQPRPYERDL